jgi:hypothetical protein
MLKRFPVPATRLPFVNTEIARVDLPTGPHLVSSIWGGAIGGRLFFWNPVTASQFTRPLPEAIPGAYMLKTGLDGRLYLGCGNGQLVCYDPLRDQFDLLVRDAMHDITWGGCVVGRHVVWSSSPGAAAVYDLQRNELVKVFQPIDRQSPPALYAHRVIATPDGNALLAMNVPQARLILLDLSTLSAASHTPPSLAGRQFTRDILFIDSQIIGLVVGGGHDRTAQEFLVLGYRDFALKQRIANPPDAGDLDCKACVLDGCIWAHGREDRSLYRLRYGNEAWERVAPSPVEGELLALYPWDQTNLAGITLWGETILHDTRSGRTSAMRLDASAPVPPHALCVIPKLNRIIGAPYISQRFWEIDTSTGAGRDLGRAALGSGQINQILFDHQTQQVLMSSYTSASIVAYRPGRPLHWGDNPRILASARADQQMRPMALAHDGRHVWMGTNPQYGLLGGALCRLDPISGELRTWRHLIRDCGINSIVIDPASRTLYFGTNIWGDCASAAPTQETAFVGAFDIDRLELQSTARPLDHTPWARVHVLLPGGAALISASTSLFAWNSASEHVQPLGPAPGGMHGVLADTDGRLWAATSQGVGKLIITDSVSFELRWPGELHLPRIIDQTLWCAHELEIISRPLGELD